MATDQAGISISGPWAECCVRHATGLKGNCLFGLFHFPMQKLRHTCDPTKSPADQATSWGCPRVLHTQKGKPYSLEPWFSSRADSAPRGYWAMSGDTLGYQN